MSYALRYNIHCMDELAEELLKRSQPGTLLEVIDYLELITYDKTKGEDYNTDIEEDLFMSLFIKPLRRFDVHDQFSVGKGKEIFVRLIRR